MSEMTTLTLESQELRLANFTGSEIHKLMGIKGLGQTGETYIFEKATEFITGQRCTPQGFTPIAAKWGIEHELEAKEYYTAATGLAIIDCKTVISHEMGGTPDGRAVTIKGQNFGIEIKCPFNSSNHSKNLLITSTEQFKDLRKEYYYQCLTYMMLMKYSKWQFVSYDPRFPGGLKMFVLDITPPIEDVMFMIKRIKEARVIFDDIVNRLKKNINE